MNKVDALIENKFSQRSIQKQREIHRLGPHQPPDIIITQSTARARRKFNTKRFQEIKWLTVSESKKSLFCFYCLLFQADDPLPADLDTWTNKGFSDLCHLSQSIKSHEHSKSHIVNAIAFRRFGREPIIAAQLDVRYSTFVKRHNDVVKTNRSVISKIIDCIKFCAVNEIALRENDERTNSYNRGIFLDLLHKEAASDSELRQHLESASVAQYTSKDSQNELLDCMFDLYLKILKSEVNAARFLSIQVDEATDISNASQFAIILRYVKDNAVVERFFKFVNIDRTALGLASTLRDQLEPFDVKEKLIAQTYDGAAVMSGRISDVQQILKDDFPFVKFVHCYAHQLNLLLKQATSGLKPCRVFFANLSSFATFFSQSPKRSDKLKEVCARQLPRPSETRWNFHSRLLETVSEQRDDLLRCVQEIQTDDMWDDTSVWTAAAIEKFLNDDEFLFFLELFNKLFQHANVLANILQSRVSTPVTSVNAIYAFRSSVEKIRNEVHFIEPTTSKKRSRSSQSDITAAAKSACDIVITQTIDRFGNNNFLRAFKLFDPSEFATYREKFPTQLFQTLVAEYPFINHVILRTELDVLYRDNLLGSAAVKSVANLLKTIADSDVTDILQEIVRGLDILLTTPSSTGEAEGSFSTLKRIKAATRNRMGQDRLNALTFLSIHKDIDIPNEHIIEEFASRKECQAALLFR